MRCCVDFLARFFRQSSFRTVVLARLFPQGCFGAVSCVNCVTAQNRMAITRDDAHIFFWTVQRRRDAETRRLVPKLKRSGSLALVPRFNGPPA